MSLNKLQLRKQMESMGEVGGCGLYSFGLGEGPVAGFFEHGNEPPDTIK